jgi:hypothetical protein
MSDQVLLHPEQHHGADQPPHLHPDASSTSTIEDSFQCRVVCRLGLVVVIEQVCGTLTSEDTWDPRVLVKNTLSSC